MCPTASTSSLAVDPRKRKESARVGRARVAKKVESTYMSREGTQCAFVLSMHASCLRHAAGVRRGGARVDAHEDFAVLDVRRIGIKVSVTFVPHDVRMRFDVRMRSDVQC